MGFLAGMRSFRSYSVMVITKDSESFDPGSSPGRTFCLVPGRIAVFVETESSFPVLVAQLDKASDYESEDWGFKSLQGYCFIFLFEDSRSVQSSVPCPESSPL